MRVPPTEEAKALGKILLEHQRKIRSYRTPETVTPDDLLTYGELCQRANLEYHIRSVGTFLCQLAEWCADRSLPPINSLAVNGHTKTPGEGYDTAPGCSEINWWNEVKACIGCDQYPTTISD